MKEILNHNFQNVKKKQHYVWKKYLLNWSDSTEEKIYSYIHFKKEVFFQSPENIAQQRYFYELYEFTIEEEKKLFEFIKVMGSGLDHNLNIEIFKTYTIYSNLKRQLDTKYIHKLNPKEIEIYESDLRVLKANTIENFHSRIENLGKNLISVNKFEDLNYLNSKQELYNTILFICFQANRTKSMKSNLVELFQNDNFIDEKFINVTPLLVSYTVAQKLCIENDLKFIYFDNQTSEKFLTTDQPVINLDKDDVDSDGNIKKLRYYYPISPEIALIIHTESQNEKYLYQEADINLIEKLNMFMIKNSKEFIITKTNNQLDKYMNSL